MTKSYRAKQCQTIGTQTDPIIKSSSETFERNFFENLIKCITELFKVNIAKESEQARSNLVKSALLNNCERRQIYPASISR